MSVETSIAAAFPIEVGQIDEGSPDPFNFVELPTGEFLMGGSDEDRYVSAVELPRRKMAVTKRIAMGRSPVTQCEWARFKKSVIPGSNGSCLPVTGVTWEEAVEYADWLGARTDKACRLPSEIEWEFAARAGNDALFPSGRNRLSLNEANYLYNEMGDPVGRGHMTPIGSYPPNPFGLFDMSGNVSEWTSSPWTRSPGQISQTPGARYVTKGGSWDQLPRTMRCSSRDWALRSASDDNLGFRLVIELD